MTKEEMAKELKERYESANINEATMQIHLFGIEHGAEIKKKRYKAKDIVSKAGLGSGYVAELSKGIKLSDKVVSKEKERNNG